MRRFVWAWAYGVLLAGLCAYALLDAFVIPRTYAAEIGAVSQASGQEAAVVFDKEAAIDDASSEADADADADAQESAEEAGSESASTEPVVTDSSYQDEIIEISIESIRVSDTTVYVADIQVSSAEYLKTAFAQAAYGRNIKSETSEIAEEAGALLAINGDFYGWRDEGYVIRNGVLYRDIAEEGTDALVIDASGAMYAANQSEVTAQELLDAGAWQVESFGPVLVEDGQVVVGQSEEVGQAMRSNPRTAIGMVDPLHYVIVVSDGRSDESEGLSLYELAEVFADYGCDFAYNLDGGGSSTLWFMGDVVNDPSSRNGEREVSDIVYIGY